MAAVAQQLGLTDDPTSVVDAAGRPDRAGDASPSRVRRRPGGLATAPPSPDPGTVAAPTAGAAPGTLPPAPPTDPSAPSGTEPGPGPAARPGPARDRNRHQRPRAIHGPTTPAIGRPQATGRRPRPTGRRRALPPTRPPGRTLRPVPRTPSSGRPERRHQRRPDRADRRYDRSDGRRDRPGRRRHDSTGHGSTTPPVADPTTPPTGAAAGHHHTGGTARTTDGTAAAASTRPGTAIDPTSAAGGPTSDPAATCDPLGGSCRVRRDLGHVDGLSRAAYAPGRSVRPGRRIRRLPSKSRSHSGRAMNDDGAEGFRWRSSPSPAPASPRCSRRSA